MNGRQRQKRTIPAPFTPPSPYEHLRSQLPPKGILLLDDERRLTKELDAPGVLSESALRLDALYSFLWGSVFTLTLICAFFLTLWALRPFALGWESYAIATVVTLALAFLVEVIVSKFRLLYPAYYQPLILTLAASGLLFGLLASASLSIIRSQEMVIQSTLNNQSPAVTVERETPTQSEAHTTTSLVEDLHQKLAYLSLPFMLSLAIALEFLAGIALHEALANLPAVEKLSRFRKRRRLRRQIISLLTNSPGRPVFIGLLLALVALFLLLFVATLALAQEVIVVGIDTTTSSPAEELSQNLYAVEQIISTLPPGARLVILPINGSSFSSPPLLDARLTADAGPFGERLTAGKQQLLNLWQAKKLTLKADSKETDIFGACAKASILFVESPGHEYHLIFLCDMRQVVRDYNFEDMAKIDPAMVQEVEQKGLIPPLQNVKVFALGVHTSKATAAYWLSLKKFWEAYFRKAGAELAGYSPNRRWQP